MKDSEILKEFIRIEKTKQGIQILVRNIEWDGPHTPVSTWDMVMDLPGDASENDLQVFASKVLEDSRYFSVCAECDQRNPVGWMHDDRICQGCAQANHGIQY